MNEGLQIQRYCVIDADEILVDDKGEYCHFEDAEQFHSMAQEALGKNMILATENKKLVEDRDEARCDLRVMMRNLDYYQELFDAAGWLYHKDKRLPLGQRIKAALEEIAST